VTPELRTGHNLIACNACPFVRWGSRTGACTKTGNTIQQQAAADHCPAGKFGDGQPIPLTVGRVAHGAAGLYKAAVGRDRAAEEVIAARRATCDACEHAAKLLGIVKECGLCKCSIRAKTALASERCPAGKWESEQPGAVQGPQPGGEQNHAGQDGDDARPNGDVR
jgi:hypothetical protein